jgi:hypothetical protein
VNVEFLPYIHGALMMGCFVIGLKFLKYWRLSRDRFFVFFASAFWIFAIGWAVRAFLQFGNEHGHLAYVPRLLAFLLILIGIFDKNRRSSKE